MKVLFIILLLTISNPIFSQNKTFPNKLEIGDSLTIHARRFGCWVTHNDYYSIVKKNDSLLMVYFISPHIESYTFEKNELFRKQEEISIKFLDTNNIELGKKYKTSEKPLKSLIGDTDGLTAYLDVQDGVDSSDFYTNGALEGIKLFYNQIRTNSFPPDTIVFAGNVTIFNIEIKSRGETNILIKDKKVGQWRYLNLSSKYIYYKKN